MIYDILPVNNYQGNNSSTNFDFSFYIENENQLKVYLYDENSNKIELKNAIDYSIHEVGNKNGSYITFPLSMSNYGVLNSNQKISLELYLLTEQITQYNNSSLLNLSALENSFDYLTRLIQILKRKISLCIKVDECSGTTPEDLVSRLNNSVLQVQNSEINIKNLKLETEKLKSEIDSIYNASLEIQNNFDELSSSVAEISNKSNIDLSNTIPSQSFISQSISWSLPDYSAITTYTFGTAVPSDGYVCAQVKVAAGTTATITIDGVNTFLFGSRGTSPWTHSPLFPVCKGQVVDCNNTQGIDSSYFMPLKGAN